MEAAESSEAGVEFSGAVCPRAALTRPIAYSRAIPDSTSTPVAIIAEHPMP
jgi:hypothetical protein